MPAVSRYLASPTAAALRVSIPAPADEPGAGGRLVLLGDDPPNELERIAADRIAALLALSLPATRPCARPGRRPAAATRSPPTVRRGSSCWPARRRPIGRTTSPLAKRPGPSLRLLVSPRRLALRGTSESLELRLVAAAPADDAEGLAIGARIAGFLGRVVAISRPFREPGARPAAEASARATLEAAEALDDPPALARATRLPAYLLLGNVRNLPDGLRQARELLAPILVGREAVQEERLRTLAAILETSSLGEAAGRLGVHRNTVAYRVQRLEVLGGWDLSDPDLRFSLALATRIVRQGH